MKHNAYFQPTTTLNQPGSVGRRTALSLIILCLITVLALGMCSPAAQAQTYKEQTLHTFTGSTTDGSSPQGDLINVNGILYGTTNRGGANNEGTLFSIDSATNVITTLYSFGAATDDGVSPTGLLNVNGILYGTAYGGGTNGDGAIFSFDPATNTEKTLYSFNASSGAANRPIGTLILVNNILYGATFGGGTSNGGALFSFDPFSLAEKTIHSFGATPADGAYPESGLLSVNGILYGTTITGSGASGDGTLYSFDLATSTEQILHTFTGTGLNDDGRGPNSALINVNGTLYGTTENGGDDDPGTVFAFTLAHNVYQIVYSFTGSGGDGANPYAALLNVNGILYGTTYGGGISNQGTVFSVDPSTYTETTLYRFQGGSDGKQPYAALLNVNGVLYGTTTYGGTSNDGTVFSLAPVSPPTAVNDKYLLKYATAYAVHAPGVLANDNSGGQTPLTATLVTHVTHGTLTFNSDGSFLYTPNAGFVGTDTFTYKAANPTFQGSTATVSLVVQAVVPVAHNDAYVPTYNKAYAVKAPGVLANDFNGDNSSMTAALVAGPTHGTLTFNSDGSFLYTSKLGFAGTDTFTYQAIDPIGKSNTATVTITIHPIIPIAYNDVYAPKYATAYRVNAPGVLANDDTGGTTPLTAALVTNVAHGTLTFNSDGSFLYTPATGFVGSDTFTYKNSTTVGTSNTATVTLKVMAAVPVARNDAYTVKHNTALTVNAATGVLANDYTGDNVAPTAALVTSTTHGSLAFHSDGSFTYTPTSGYSGTDSFTYKDTNPIGTSNTATVTLTVQ